MSEFCLKKSLKIPKEQSKSVNRRRTDNTEHNAQKKKDKRTNNDSKCFIFLFKTKQTMDVDDIPSICKCAC